MTNPATGGGALKCRSGRLDASEHTRSPHDPQAAARAIEAGLIALPDACDTAFILRRRLDLRERIWLGFACLLSLPPATAEQMADFASRAERCHYLAAAWGQLSPDDRRRFLRRAL